MKLAEEGKLYQYKEWLILMYWEKRMSLPKIAELCGVTHGAINHYMIKFKIPRRPRAEGSHLGQAKHCKLTEEAKEFIDGELLGDGGLVLCSHYSARFNYTSQYEEYMKFIANILASYGIEISGEIHKQCYEDKPYSSFHYHSRCYPELLPIYRRWYPNSKRIIPKDLKLTSLVLRQKYIGDGCLVHQKKREWRPHIVLSTNAFPIADVEWLVKQLEEIGFYATRQPSNNSICIFACSTRAFLAYIGKCPVKCYQYKWELEKQR